MDHNQVKDGIDFQRGPNVEVVAGPPGLGLTQIKRRRVTRVVVPPFEDARSGVIRLHEMMHAQKSPVTGGNILDQAVEDVMIHAHHLPLADLCRTTRKDIIETALEDLRALPVIRNQLNQESSWNSAIAIAARSVASIHGSGYLENSFANLRQLILNELNRSLAGKEGESMVKVLEALQVVCQLAFYGKRKEAKEILGYLMRRVPPDLPGIIRRAKTKIPGLGKMGRLPSAMRVYDLPKTIPCEPHGEGEDWVSSGSRFVVSRLPVALATLSTAGLFRKEVPFRYDGAVLIDASGSMGVTQASLEKLCQAASGITVAYYAGWDDSPPADNHHGDLVIYARDGMRSEKVPRVGMGGNGVDLWALEWLLQQPPPLYFVTDCGFCSGPHNQHIKAHGLLVANRERVRVFGSIGSAMAFFSPEEAAA